MTCEQWREEISAWVDGELTSFQRREVARHARSCPGCRQALVNFRAITLVMRAGHLPGVSPRVSAAAMSLVVAKHRQQASWLDTFFAFPKLKAWLAVSGVVLACAVALALDQRVSLDNPFAPTIRAVQEGLGDATDPSAVALSRKVVAGELAVADTSQGAAKVTAFARLLGGEAHAVPDVGGSTVMVTIPADARETFLSGLSGFGQWHNTANSTAIGGSSAIGIKIIERP
jgi:anti-sigma factor RsiW